ncbi:MAG: ABC transporter substrate-binding protein [Clostridia bacterium]|nr:ABC transporter substrate-binding protein [Clostridia bacterium]
MKKTLSLILTVIMLFGVAFSFAACIHNNDDTDDTNTQKTSIKLSVLNGTTGFGMAKLMEDDENETSSNDYEFKVETDATNIVSALIAGSIDMAALPTNAAANVYNKTNGQVQVLAINTLGVLYLIEKDDQISSIQDLNGKTIYVPAQNPTFITKHILDSNNINATIDSTTYDTPAALQAAVISGQVELAVLPQPVLTAAMSGAKKANINYNIALDLTEEWNKIPNSEELVQGCIVVRKSFAEANKGAVDAFLTEYENSINYLNQNVTDASALIVKYGIFANATVAENAIPKCNVAFMKGEEMKSAMSAFVAAMYNIAPASIGNSIPEADFYYIP